MQIFTVYFKKLTTEHKDGSIVIVCAEVVFASWVAYWTMIGFQTSCDVLLKQYVHIFILDLR